MRGQTDAFRNPWIDILRGIAAVAVALFHFNEPVRGGENLYRNTVFWGWLGVPVFFVLSGFVVHSAAQRSHSIGEFSWRRLTRIMPPYWASVLLVGAIAGGRKLLFGVNDIAEFPKDLYGWIATLTAMTAPATSTRGVNWVYWTLTYEIAFYAVTVVALISPRWFPHVVVALATLNMVPANPPLTSLPGLFFLSHWGLYGLGIAASLAHQRRRSAALVVFLACAIATPLNMGLPATVTAFATVVFLSASNRVARWPVHNSLVQLGVMSYSLYLIHVPVGCYVLVRWKEGQWATNPWWNLAYDGVVLIVCLAAAWIFYLLVERPSIWLGRVSHRSAARVCSSPA